MIEFQNVASYILELLRIFNPDLEKRPEKSISSGHFVIQGKIHTTIMGAIEREKQIKSWSRKKKLVLIEKDNPLWQDLFEKI